LDYNTKLILVLFFNLNGMKRKLDLFAEDLNSRSFQKGLPISKQEEIKGKVKDILS
jgi:hypothetical protein